jgi:glycosyltransferase involved in cell wall biosynthesis
LKLLFLNHNVAWSGTFFRAFQLARALVLRGHRVTLVTTSPTARLGWQRRQRDGVDLVETPDLLWGRARTGWDPWNTLHRSFGLGHADFDAIHAFDCRPAVILPARWLASRGDLPLFLDWADWWGRGGAIAERPGRVINRMIEGVETWFEEAFRHRAAGTTVISRALEGRAVTLGVRKDSMHRFPNGCDHESILPRDRRGARAELGIDDGDELVVHLGLLYPGDLELLLGAMEILRRARPRARLALVGNPRSPMPRSARRDGVLLPGFVDFATLQRWLAAADCCVLPLRDTICNRGRWPGKVSDYLCAGRPVVMTRVGDAAEWIEAGGAGWTSGAEPEALAEALMEPLRAPDAGRAAGERGRRLAETRLAWATVAGELDGFYDEILARARPVLARSGLTARTVERKA